ncbi:hypothetical protein MHUMG1_07660 [Metarhizium humberi]|uniref:Uncharacterized protein n=1 Tax=Metarhizium humberi TaxID=2596975 RepID=A0A9P8M678_9HYPO|nr:hypothetical protein MHUMG1_07660 [Metarhizium humberi]
MAEYFEKVVAFGTDSVALERLMRLIQSVCSITVSYGILIPPPLSSATPTVQNTTGELALRELTDILHLTRRAIRLFWCFGSFKSSCDAYGAPGKNIEAWLSILADSLFGLFGFMESITLLDLLKLDKLSIFGFEEAVRIDGQSQSLWLCALTCSLLRYGVNILHNHAKPAVLGAANDDKSADAGEQGESKDASVVAERKQQEGLAKERSRIIWGSRRKALADALDIIIPAWKMGLLKVDLGFVSIAMLFSSILTGYAAWERCG